MKQLIERLQTADTREKFRLARVIRYLAKRRRRENARFVRLFYSNGEAWQ